MRALFAKLRLNILIILILAVGLVLGMAAAADFSSETLAGMVMVVLAIIATTAKELIDPVSKGDPDPGREIIELPARVVEKLVDMASRRPSE